MDMVKSGLCVLVLTGALAASPAVAQVASFDCPKARTDTEWAICNTPQLGALDVRMAANYALLEAIAPAGSSLSESLKSSQGAWIDGTRNPCGGAVACLATAYRNRIEALTTLAQSSLTVK
ncbi:lysozyme inhibitor LprI family protein [Pelagibacterium halotolerans]|uniref:lysozyme inhibitor LprI family protein n=1 Tax=Pelagibacterium halotolerans TaxID=531813 RepID=UPI00384D670D